MPLIVQHEIADIISALKARNSKLIHACQLQDFRSYIALGGIPSRAEIEQSNMPFTPFNTDEIDHTNQIWDKVFFNLSDFSDWFAKGKSSLPNPYGPIALFFIPEVLTHAMDISVTLRSAGANGFDRVAEGIALDDFPRIFVNMDGRPKRLVKFKTELESLFPGKVVGTPEINCTYPNQIAPIGNLAFALVDSYRGLADAVRAILIEHGIRKRVIERYTIEERKDTYQSLWDAIADGCDDIEKVLAQQSLDAPTRKWCENVASKDTLSFQFKRFARYLKAGTIDHI